MQSKRTAAVVAAAGTLLASGGVAIAATHHAAQQGGAVHVYVQQFTSTTAKVLFTGAVGDYGKIVSTNQAGKVDANGTYQVAHLTHGTITIDSSGFDKALQHLRPVVNRSNCSVTLTGSGPSTITGGTGEYAGASGSVKITATFAAIAAKKNGTCDLSNNSPEFGAFNVITGSGTIHFGS